MINGLDKVPDLLKLLLHSKILAALGIASGVLLVLPGAALEGLQIDAKIKPWVGITFLVSVSGLLVHGLVHGLVWAWARQVRAHEARDHHSDREARLRRASPDELRVLAGYWEDQDRWQELPCDHEVVSVMCRAGIIDRPHVRGTRLAKQRGTGSLRIREWVWDFLEQHPDFLQGVSPLPEPSPYAAARDGELYRGGCW